MAETGTITGRVDARSRLIEADPALRALQTRCGGTVPGAIAIPELAMACALSRHLGMRLARRVHARGGDFACQFWVQISPDGDGMALAIHDWQESGATPAPAPAPLPIRAGADAVLKVDSNGLLIGFDAGADMALDAHLQAHLLRHWTTAFEAPDLAARFSPDAIVRLPWTAFDQCRLAASETSWLASVEPLSAPDGSPTGCHIALSKVRPPIEQPSAKVLDGAGLQGIFGKQLGPALRQPIGRIIANAETIGNRMQGPIRADYAGYAQDIANAGRHLLELVDDLADLEAVEKSGFTVANDRIDLADLARRAAGLLAIKAADHQIRIEPPDHDESLPAIGEFRRVLQILLNLVTNAIRYSPDGSMVWIRLEGADGRAQVIVADQGPGIAADEQVRMFDKFERLGRSGDGGSGLGLYISRRLAEAMGGSLTVDSAPGQGARFVLELPGASSI